MHRVAHNKDFLRETLKDTIQVDEFTGNLFKIWETVMEEGVAQVNNLFYFLLEKKQMYVCFCVFSHLAWV